MWVKICGTTTLEDARLAADAGADAIGCVFAESKRRVLPVQVAGIASLLPSGVEFFGVFHTHPVEEIVAASKYAGLSGVQIHRPYDADTVRELRSGLGPDVKLLQVVPCAVDGLDVETLTLKIQAARADGELWGILLDASHAGISGGTGQSFDWKQVEDVLDGAWPDRGSGPGPKLVLAGGLRPENVREAMAVLRPDGVDVVSGVESAPGAKDAERVRAFVAAAHSEGHPNDKTRH